MVSEMNREFWLLDLNSDEKEGKPQVWLWGITPEGKRIIITENYRPYFYILPKASQNPANLKARLEKERLLPSIVELSIENKKLLSQERTVIRVVASSSENLAKLATKIVKFLGAEAFFEADLRPATKYQNDFQVHPCQWYGMEVETEPATVQARIGGETLQARNRPAHVLHERLPDLRAIGFTMLAVSQVGSPSPERDPIRVLAWNGSDGRGGTLRSDERSDENILSKFSEVVQAEDPDFIFSFGGNSAHWPYLLKRAEKTRVSLTIGRDAGPPRQSLFGHFSVTGRANVDLLDFAGDLYDVKEKTLGAVTRYLGVRDARETVVEETDNYDYWSDPHKRDVLTKMVGQEAETILTLGTDALDYVVQLSALSNLPPDHVLAGAAGFRVDSHMMMEAHRLGQLIPPRNEVPAIPYRGAIVLQPEPGLHDNVAVVDFSSMYPSLMVKYNISPDTLTEEKGDEVYTVPEVGTSFRKTPPGLYAQILSDLIQNRKMIKAEIARSTKGTSRYRILKAREKAAKIITNATYGYAGWAGSRWYSKQVAESAAAMGRDTINKSIGLARQSGLKVLYGDTDSLFVNYDKDRVDRFIAAIDQELGLEINLSQVYKRILFTEARKKYAVLKENGELDLVGMEAIRGDWSSLAKEVQNKVLQFVLEDKTPDRALSYVRQLSHELASQKRPLSSFVIWKTLTKRPEQYDVHAPHVEAAKKIVKLGWPVTSGDRVGYVIEMARGKLYERAEPYFKTSIDNIDIAYYLQNQVLPVAARALSIFGITEENILEAKGRVEG